MTEHKLFEGAVPYVSTAEFHADRERAPHLEQAAHRPRLEEAAEYVVSLGTVVSPVMVSDLGCGDGGLLQLLKDRPEIESAWGYDFAPANAAGWTERGVRARAMDVFGADWDSIGFGDVVVMTEVLEHLADPHRVLRLIREQQADVMGLVCSSPWNEGPGNHSPEHAWAWDVQGYRDLLEGAGWSVVRHEQVGLFQVVMAVPAQVAP